MTKRIATVLATGAAGEDGRFCTGFADRIETRAADLMVFFGLAVAVDGDGDANHYELTGRGTALARSRAAQVPVTST